MEEYNIQYYRKNKRTISKTISPICHYLVKEKSIQSLKLICMIIMVLYAIYPKTMLKHAKINVIKRRAERNSLSGYRGYLIFRKSIRLNGMKKKQLGIIFEN